VQQQVQQEFALVEIPMFSLGGLTRPPLGAYRLNRQEDTPMFLRKLSSAGVFAISLGIGLTASVSARAHGRHSISLQTHGKEPIESCSDLQARSEYGDVAVKEESRTITRAEASRLSVWAEDNGAMQIQGWDKNEYSASLC
jgi:hypothetical protein